MANFVNTSRHDDVVVLEIDNPPVNALSPGVPEALCAAIGGVKNDAGVRAIVVRGAGRMFVAGADIATLQDAVWGDESRAPDWHDALRSIEDSTVPIVMAIHGAALGGGLELALAGHYRVAVSDAQMGQPEVNLGVIPGGEGTQRLPRVSGIATALEMCVTGRSISAVEAAAHGIVDEIIGADLTPAAVAFARRMVLRGPPTKTRDRRDRLGNPSANAALFTAARELAATVHPHESAPRRAIEAIEAAALLPFDDGCRREREMFFECLRGEQAKALIHMFFAERTATKRSKTPGAAKLMRAVGVRLTSACVDETQFLVAEGATPEDVDRALTEFGFDSRILGSIFEMQNAREPTKSSAAAQTPTMSDRAIVERLTYVLVNEGARALTDGDAASASEIDVIGVKVCGFPVWRGGPLFYADRAGLGVVLARIESFRAAHGSRWEPAPLLADLARNRRRFADVDRSRNTDAT